MSFLGLNLVQWTGLVAIGTLALALATTAAIFATMRITRTDRTRDDDKRREDRADMERRYQAEERDREDYEARQVSLTMTSTKLHLPEHARGSEHQITFTAPAAYPVKQVSAQIAHQGNAGIGITDGGYTFGEPATENGRTVYRMLAEVPETLHDPHPVARFTDRHGNLYYAYRGHTMRSPQNTDYLYAASKIDKWIRTGPRPDDPETAP